MERALTLSDALQRYWHEVAKHKPSADDTFKALEDIERLLGPETLLTDINSEKIAAAAARRAAEPIMVRKRDGPVSTGKVVSLSTVNRQVIEPLRRVLRRARRVWRVPIDLEDINWSDIRYREPEGRTRELTIEEGERFWAALRSDYHPICRFYLLTGRRRSEVIALTKFDVDLRANVARYAIVKRNRKDKRAKTLSTMQAAILRSEMEKSRVEAVFTYEIQRGERRGERAPITQAGLKTELKRAFRLAGLVDFHQHDMRHTFASALLRANGGNYGAVQKALEHTDIKSTQKYAHVLDADVVAGIEKLEASRSYPGAQLSEVSGQVKKN